ncbi:putative G antigen family E member 3 [Ictidomys tridecemlineatus]|uniref:putative G antigen family E member 3 n=1 Tax=Ictidomys tridecemlineatus TaxID=43179 RepID=UPI001A9E7ECE|nr:putative G antigen family E member 3 [Ictidomys tridecemlineatus]
MRRQERPRTKAGGRQDEQESSQPVESVVAQESGEEAPQQTVPPRENQENTLIKERESERQPKDQGASLKADLHELSLIKTGGKKEGDCLDVKMEFVTSLDPTQVTEAGEGQQDVQMKTS